MNKLESASALDRQIYYSHHIIRSHSHHRRGGTPSAGALTRFALHFTLLHKITSRPPEPLEASQNEVGTKLDMAVVVGRGSMVNYGAVTLKIHPGKVSRQKCLG